MTDYREFDSNRSAAIERMLVRAVERTEPSTRRRILLMVSLAVVAIVLAGGSVAWALGLRIMPSSVPVPQKTSSASPTPTPTATPTPTPTRTEAANTGVPKPTVPVGCSDLVSPATLSILLPAGSLYSDGVQPYTPRYAALQQAGVVSCTWATSTGSSPTVNLDVSTAAALGRSNLSSEAKAGLPSLGVGEASTYHCADQSCTADVQTGAYWFTFNVVGISGSPADNQRNVASFANAIIDELRQHPTPEPSWTGPATSWTPVGCSAVASDAQMQTVTSTPDLKRDNTGPIGGFGAIYTYLPAVTDCLWSKPDISNPAPAGQFRIINVQIAPGAAWAYQKAIVPISAGDRANGEQRPATTVTPTTVAGADDAATVCQDNGGCWLNVLIDNSWMQLGFQTDVPPNQAPILVDIAELIIANHH